MPTDKPVKEEFIGEAKVIPSKKIDSKIWRQMKWDMRDQIDELNKIGEDYAVFQNAQYVSKTLKKINLLMMMDQSCVHGFYISHPLLIQLIKQPISPAIPFEIAYPTSFVQTPNKKKIDILPSNHSCRIACEIDNTENLLEKHLKKIADRLESVLQESKKNNESTDLVATRIAWKRINS